MPCASLKPDNTHKTGFFGSCSRKATLQMVAACTDSYSKVMPHQRCEFIPLILPLATSLDLRLELGTIRDILPLWNCTKCSSRAGRTSGLLGRPIVSKRYQLYQGIVLRVRVFALKGSRLVGNPLIMDSNPMDHGKVGAQLPCAY